LQGKAAKEHHYSKFYTYVKAHPGLLFRIELIMESEDALSDIDQGTTGA
jgi:hypothetical protein